MTRRGSGVRIPYGPPRNSAGPWPPGQGSVVPKPVLEAGRSAGPTAHGGKHRWGVPAFGKLGEQNSGGQRDRLDRSIDRGLIGGTHRGQGPYLAHELQRCGPNFVLGCDGFKSPQRGDVATHEVTLARRPRRRNRSTRSNPCSMARFPMRTVPRVRAVHSVSVNLGTMSPARAAPRRSRAQFRPACDGAEASRCG